ncbi:MAG: biotin/lipoyl-containing protein [Planctomycetota bacterium]
MTSRLVLVAQHDGDALRLLSPEVGTFSGGLAHGHVLAPGQEAGRLEQLGRSIALVVPDEVTGRVQSKPFERVHQPVGYRDVLYELAPILAPHLATGTKPASDSRSAVEKARSGGLVLRAAQSGRFYQRPAPGESAFVATGATIEDGQPIGMIEVMKTFTHVVYRATAGLPARAKVLRVVAADGAEVRAGDVLLELESA